MTKPSKPAQPTHAPSKPIGPNYEPRKPRRITDTQRLNFLIRRAWRSGGGGHVDKGAYAIWKLEFRRDVYLDQDQGWRADIDAAIRDERRGKK